MSETSTTTSQTLSAELPKDGKFRILSLDGGGAKGFYTLGVLAEIEGMLRCPLYKRFDLIFGTSTGAIIASLLALGYSVDQIHDLYTQYVPAVMRAKSPAGKSKALAELAKKVFGDKTFKDVKTAVGIVATRWVTERPMIFKASVAQAHGRAGTFEPGFGVSVADAVQASCSAYPFFERKTITTSKGDKIELVDGGYCANNPTLYALVDAVRPLKIPLADLRVVSVGVGIYPSPKGPLWIRMLKKCWGLNRFLLPLELLQKTLEINTQSMEQLQFVACKDLVDNVRINEKFERPEMATDLMEHDLDKLNQLRQRGRESFEKAESDLRRLLL